MPRQRSPIKQRLEQWHLKRVPFPAVPFVNPFSSDPLCNGSVFEPTLRAAEIQQIKLNILRGGFHEMIRPWSWVWARRTLGGTIGMGKTALFSYIADQINHDYGTQFFGHAAHWLAVYVLAPPRASSIDEIAALALASICNDVRGTSIERLLLARLRHKVIALGLAGAHDPGLERAAQRNFARDSWLADRGIDLDALARVVETHLCSSGVTPEVAQAIARGALRDYLIKVNGNPSLVPPKPKLIARARTLLLNDLAAVARAGGILHITFLLDDFFYLVRRTSLAERPHLAAELRAISVDGDYTSARHRLYDWVAVMHSQTAPRFKEAWEARDMQVVAPLDRLNPASVVLEPFTREQAQALLSAYLKHQRPKGAPTDIYPFTPDALDAIADIINEQGVSAKDACEPRRLLVAAFNVFVEALTRDADSAPIGSAFVEHVLKGTPLPEVVDSDEDIAPSEEPLPLARVCPCTCHQDEDVKAQDLVALLAGGKEQDDGQRIVGYRCAACNMLITAPIPVEIKQRA